jgi:hypothetical protein
MDASPCSIPLLSESRTRNTCSRFTRIIPYWPPQSEWSKYPRRGRLDPGRIQCRRCKDSVCPWCGDHRDELCEGCRGGATVRELSGGWDDGAPRQTPAADPAHLPTEHGSRVSPNRTLGPGILRIIANKKTFSP